ncbi:hypothetical protein SAMN05660236_3054 [Ohtaekwangia koreensis]|uniref:DUF4468 domain-containing protein n=1 Tax=Ohtaekwangia koreensis TaxID=688867 RepID=A0A1T5LE50_9BACT|nr:hypothetical protein SAMN05660236_3054 [Ohtaekwangia koreensis]
MHFIKKFTWIVLFTSSVLTMSAQTVKVKKENTRITGDSAEGYEVELEGTVNEVHSAFTKFLKLYGKVKQSEGILTINELAINGSTYTFSIYATVKETGKNATAWIGSKSSGQGTTDASNVHAALEKLIADFGIKYYRDKIQVQIDETNRAYQAVEKQKQRLANENKTLLTKVEDNKREKIQLEKALENNKLENETLLKRIEKNKLDQDSVALAGEQSLYRNSICFLFEGIASSDDLISILSSLRLTAFTLVADV